MKPIPLDQIKPGWHWANWGDGNLECVDPMRLRIDKAGIAWIEYDGSEFKLLDVAGYITFGAPIPSLEVCRAIYDKQKED